MTIYFAVHLYRVFSSWCCGSQTWDSLYKKKIISYLLVPFFRLSRLMTDQDFCVNARWKHFFLVFLLRQSGVETTPRCPAYPSRNQKILDPPLLTKRKSWQSRGESLLLVPQCPRFPDWGHILRLLLVLYCYSMLFSQSFLATFSPWVGFPMLAMELNSSFLYSTYSCITRGRLFKIDIQPKQSQPSRRIISTLMAWMERARNALTLWLPTYLHTSTKTEGP